MNDLRLNDLAIDEFSKALDLDPGEASYWSGRCAARVQIANELPALSTERSLMSALGIKDAERALKLNPLDAETWNLKGCCYSYQGDKRAAIQTRSEAIRLSPLHSEYWANRGLAQLMDPLPKGPPHSALKDIDKGIEINDKCPIAWKARGDYFTKKQAFSEASEAYRRAAELESNIQHRQHS
eukprot:Protomagalhaensia_wolfi_Nauph_80__1916@NODE_2201_length_1172_cov_6_620477_g1720_i0_p1_GENE_NODE_2201_length_1172_cov_6_620477_g1720_i0NODE_2201_length_1172_cov_6_620477_g1720_i0_p1_ORF_typecomplete_len183_score26_43TPR_11/PF13414_6/0_003TPR_11/PF13414_6/0_16TPR_11/PF13414_6/0_00026TPR_11/PF13414_6/11TPR_11/PF13414_6/1_2TPR_16/PF13432_6/0_24TPR_16/PF13432_6/1_6e06TPR_16/PF13432_6/7_2TPR_16/PF13432_6/0_0017TPR_9/PF13371_6/4_8TPR_9/PF13371_6/4_2e05TPR_9/PF13371_6/0_092TPR_1/PF00515_28/0_34TPR_1/PF0